MKFTSKFSNSESTNTVTVVLHKPSVVWGISHLAGNELVLYPFPWWRYQEYSSSTWVEVFAKLHTSVKLKISALANLIEIKPNDCKFMQSREDTQVGRPTNGTCMEATCLHTNWKGDEGRFKRKRTIPVSINSNPKRNLLENKLGGGLSICPHPVETLHWPQGLKDLYPRDSLDLWKEFHFMFIGNQQNKLLWSFLKGVMKG